MQKPRSWIALLGFIIFNAQIVQADFLNGVSNTPTLVEKTARCASSPEAPHPTLSFCSALSYLREHIEPLEDVSSILNTPHEVIFLGDDHPDRDIKTWLSRHMEKLHSLGFTHFAMEAIPSNQQSLLNNYEKNPSLRPQVVAMLAKEWGWIPEVHTQLIDAAIKAGLHVVGIDRRFKGEAIHDQNQHMADQIASILASQPGAKVLAFTGSVHSRTTSPVHGLKTVAQLLSDEKIESLTFTLKSGYNFQTERYAQIYVAEKLNGVYFLPLPRSETLRDGIIYTPHSW